MAQTIIEAIIEHSIANPNRICLADGKCSISYYELVSSIKKIGSYLYSKNIKYGDKVILQSSSTCQYMQILLALQFIKAIVVPVDASLSDDSLNSLIKSVSPSMVILNSCKKLDADLCFSTVKETCSSAFGCSKLENYSLPKKDDVCEILFTTGTTGTHKGIVLTFDNNVALSENVIHSTGMKDDNVELIFAPLNHSHGLRRLYANLYNGTTVVLHSNIAFVSDVFYKIEKYNVNSFDFVPSALSIILKFGLEKFATYANRIRFIQFGGASVKKNEIDLLKKYFPDTKIINMYGSTESGVSIAYEYNNKGEDKANCIGKPTFNSHIQIVDDKHQPIQSTKNNPGFIATSSRANMKGYYSKDSDSASFDEYDNNMVYSNDLAYIDEDGDIILLGRKGVVINAGGYKIIPQELERIALEYEQIDDCACIGIDDQTLGQVPVLFITLKNSDIFDMREFHASLKNNLEYYKMPKYIKVIDSIPRSPKGSILYAKLKEIQL